MDKLLTVIGAVVMVVAVVLFSSVICGTIIWGLWDHIHAIFPTAAENGVIAKHVGWWDAVCFSWIIGALLQVRNSDNSKKDK